MLQNDPEKGGELRALKNIFTRHVAEEAPPAVNSHPPDQTAAPELAAALPAPRPQPAPATADAIIRRFEPLLAHCPRNTKVLESLAEAYARKGMFDRSLDLYRRALEIAGGKNAAIEEAIENTTLKEFDVELSQLDPQAPDHAAQLERIQNKRLDYQWHEMEESH
jgi:hypothetical protein